MISTVHISGMRSVHCVRAVFTALAGVGGIDRAEVSMGRAVLDHTSPISHVAVEAAIAAVGFAVRAIDADRRRLPLHPVDGGANGMAANGPADRGDATDA